MLQNDRLRARASTPSAGCASEVRFALSRTNYPSLKREQSSPDYEGLANGTTFETGPPRPPAHRVCMRLAVQYVHDRPCLLALRPFAASHSSTCESTPPSQPSAWKKHGAPKPPQLFENFCSTHDREPAFLQFGQRPVYEADTAFCMTT